MSKLRGVVHQDENASRVLVSRNDSAPFSKLCTDCWIHILQYLKQNDKLRFAATCQRFRAVYQMTTARKYKSVGPSDLRVLSRRGIWYFFKLNGYKIQEIECSRDVAFANEVLAMIAAHCPNLISLSVGLNLVSKYHMLNMPTTIEKLELTSCQGVGDLLRICEHFPKLRELRLGCNGLHKRHLSQLTKLTCLRTLNIPKHVGMDEDIFKKFAALKDLIEFTFYAKRISYSAILELFIACPKLSSLGVYRSPGLATDLVQMIVAQVRQEKSKKELHRKLPIKLDTDKDIREVKALKVDNIINVISNFPDDSSSD